MVDITRHLEKAEEALKKKNYPFAVQLYHQLLDLKPDSEEVRRGLHQALERWGAIKKTSPLLANLSGLGPRISAFFARLGKNPVNESRAWERFLKGSPNNVSALFALGAALERAAYLKSAIVVYEHLARVAPGAEPWKKVGFLYHQIGEADSALAAFEQALKGDPRDQEALRARKNLAAEGALARSAFTRASHTQDLIKDKDKAKELERSQKVAQTRSDLSDEMESLEKKLRDNPTDSALLLQKAQTMRSLGDRDGALAILEELKDRGGAGLGALRLLGDLKIETLGEEIRACEDANEKKVLQKRLIGLRLSVARDLVEAHPTDLALHYRLGLALAASGEEDKAIAEFQISVKDPRLKLDSTLRLAKAFRKKGLADLAISQYSKALESIGSSGDKAKDVLYELGDLLEEKGETKAALEKFSKIYEADITFRDVSERIKRLGKSLGQ